MSKNRILITLIILLKYGVTVINAQEKVALVSVISTLESRFNIKFSYAVNDLKEVYVIKPNYEYPLNAIIQNLNNTSLLNFQFIDNRYITISARNKSISICGDIFSQLEGYPLEGASVIIYNSQKGANTDKYGHFEMDNIPINAILKLSYIGFESKVFEAKRLWIGNGNCKTIGLMPLDEELKQVLISKMLTTGIQKYIDGSTVFNTKKFGLLPGLINADVMQSIQFLPGVESVNETSSNINVRGGTNDQNLIIWDHIKMYHSGHFFGLISAYNPNLTNKVIVTKNGTSSEFSDGVSSTINMFTINEIGKKVTGGIGFNFLDADAFFDIPLSKKVAIQFSGRRSFTDVIDSPTYYNYYRRSFQDSELELNKNGVKERNKSANLFFYDYSAKILFDLNKNHKFRANIIGIDNVLDFNENLMSDYNLETKTINLNQNNIGGAFSWNAQWSDQFSSEYAMFYSKYNVKGIQTNTQNTQTRNEINEVLETEFKYKTNLKVNENLNLVNGLQFNEIGILNSTMVNSPTFNKISKNVLQNAALFSELVYNFNDTYLRFGIRANYFPKFDKLILEPRLNFRKKIKDDLAITFQVENKNQAATQVVDFQDNFIGIEKRRWILANDDDIPIAKSEQASIGLEYYKNDFLINVEGFYKIVKGITASNQGFYNNFQYKSATGSYTVNGMEILANKTASKYSAWVSYTLSYNNYNFEKFTPSLFPNNVDIRHSFSIAFNHDLSSNLKISLGAIWRSGQPYTKPVNGQETVQSNSYYVVNYDNPNSENLPNYFRIDTSFSYDFNLIENTNASIRLGFLNILARKNLINRYYEVNASIPNLAVQVNNTSLGFTPNISFRINFN